MSQCPAGSPADCRTCFDCVFAFLQPRNDAPEQATPECMHLIAAILQGLHDNPADAATECPSYVGRLEGRQYEIATRIYRDPEATTDGIAVPDPEPVVATAEEVVELYPQLAHLIIDPQGEFDALVLTIGITQRTFTYLGR